MNENVKKFMELVFAEGAESIERMNKANKEELIVMAAERGIKLTEEEFEEKTGKISDDELDAVTGGYIMKSDSGWYSIIDDNTGMPLAVYRSKSKAENASEHLGVSSQEISTDEWKKLFDAH